MSERNARPATATRVGTDMPPLPRRAETTQEMIARCERPRVRGFSVKPDDDHPTMLASAQRAAAKLGFTQTGPDKNGRYTFVPESEAK